MEINPFVMALMKEFATSDAELEAWIAYHHAAKLEDVLEAQEREEREELADLVGWD
jgi:hypothetical protein